LPQTGVLRRASTAQLKTNVTIARAKTISWLGRVSPASLTSTDIKLPANPHPIM